VYRPFRSCGNNIFRIYENSFVPKKVKVDVELNEIILIIQTLDPMFPRLRWQGSREARKASDGAGAGRLRLCRRCWNSCENVRMALGRVTTCRQGYLVEIPRRHIKSRVSSGKDPKRSATEVIRNQPGPCPDPGASNSSAG
jgi:hypothetical protein